MIIKKQSLKTSFDPKSSINIFLLLLNTVALRNVELKVQCRKIRFIAKYKRNSLHFLGVMGGMDKMSAHTEVGPSTALENPLGNLTISSSNAKSSDDPHLVTNIIIILLAAAVLIPLNVLLLKKNMTVFRTVFLKKNDNKKDQEFIRKNEGESFSIPIIPKEGPILVAKNIDLHQLGSPYSTVVDLTYSHPRDGSEVDIGESKRQIAKIFSGKLTPSPKVQELDSSVKFDKLLPDPNMDEQTDLLLSASSEIKKKKDADNEIFDAKLDQDLTDGQSIITSGTDAERADKLKLVEVKMAKLPRLSLAGKELLENVGITTPDTMAQIEATKRSVMPRDTVEIVETAAAVVGHSVKQARILKTPSFSTESCGAAWGDCGSSPRASTASWTSFGRIYGGSSDTALHNQISQAMYWHLSEFAASNSTVNVKNTDTFPEGSSSTDVAAQGVSPNVEHGSLQQIKNDDEVISTALMASTGVFYKNARQSEPAQQGLSMSLEASSEEPPMVLKHVNQVETPTFPTDSTQAFRKAVGRVRLVQKGIATAPTVSNETSDETVRQIKLDKQQKSFEVLSEESSETAKQVNLVEHETRGSLRASASSWSMSEGSNASLQNEISHVLQHYLSRRSSVRSEDTKEVTEEQDVDKT